MIILRYSEDIDNLLNDVKYAFQNFSKPVVVGNKDTLELYDVNYTIYAKNYDGDDKKIKAFKVDEELIETFEPHSAEDEIERFKLLAAIQRFCDNELKDDVNSRQCVIQQKYDNNETLASCISFMQLINRNNVLDLHVVVRSQNFNNNFIYDNYTFFKCLKLASEKTGIECGAIHIKVVSLHILL